MDFFRRALLLVFATLCSARLLTVPTVPYRAGNGSLDLTSLNSIIVDSRYESAVNQNGETLIPPTLWDFVLTFASDLSNATGLNLTTAAGVSATAWSIFVTLDDGPDFLDAAGRRSSEGYNITVNTNGIIIAGASPLGVWWGTRTLLQAAVLNQRILPTGSAVDTPGWGIRGVMLDVGRHYYPPEFIIELCSYLSFFKQNTFHLHLSDNMITDQGSDFEAMMSLYAAFRLDSDDAKLAGLARRKNESYTRGVFENIQQQCAARGVTVVPEIEAPGHALVISQWRPRIGLTNDYTMLNISHPDTIPTMKDIWRTLLPWFHSKTVHIGADEYESSLRSDYNHFVNEMNIFIGQESGKKVRIWGTFPPQKIKSRDDIAQNVTIQHWEFFEDNPYTDYIKNGFDVLNSDDSFYIVNKYSQSYPQSLNKTRIFMGDPAGGAFAPNIFDTRQASNNPPRSEPRVLGHIAPIWNDYGPGASVYSEAYYAWRDNLPALADKQWGGDLLMNEYDSIFESLHAAVPGQNLDRAIATKSHTILQYRFLTTNNTASTRETLVSDISGNGYDGIIHGCAVSRTELAVVLDGKCYVETPLQSKGRSYNLSFSVKPTSLAPGSLFAGPDSMLLAGNGSTNNVILAASGNTFMLDYSLPPSSWTRVSLLGSGKRTLLEVTSDSGQMQQFEFMASVLEVGATSPLSVQVAVEAPLSRVGEGFKGLIKDIQLTDGAVGVHT